MKIYGFSLLRNGIQYDYPFLESLYSLSGLCEEVVLALGKSEDGTESALGSFTNISIVPTVWDETLRKSGLILSQQTNIALDRLRERVSSGWGFYLQADEVIREADFEQIRKDLAKAESGGFQAVSFRYLHFWHSYQQIAVDKRWYPQEIRAIRLDSGARSYGDAQSFENAGKVFFSDVFIHHYGHVREAAAYEKKKMEFGRWWHGDDELKRVVAKGARRDRHESTIAYLGPHPLCMEGRMKKATQAVEEKKGRNRKEILVYGKENRYGNLQKRVAIPLRWTQSVPELFSWPLEDLVVLDPLPFWAKPLALAGFGSKVPKKMKSPQARDWDPPFVAVLRFSEKGITVV